MAKIKIKKQDKKNNELPPVTVSSKYDPRVKSYKDSLDLYNSTIDMAKNLSAGLHRGLYKDLISFRKQDNKKLSKEDIKHLKGDKEFYDRLLVDPITKGTKVPIGGIRSVKKTKKESKEWFNKAIEESKKRMNESTDKHGQDYYQSKAANESYTKIKKLNNNILPVSYLEEPQLYPVPIYKKPVQPIIVKEEEPKTIEQKVEELNKKTKTADIVLEKPQSQSGEPLYHNNDLIGFMQKDGKFEKLKDTKGIKSATKEFLSNDKSVDSYMKFRFGEYYKGQTQNK